MMSYNLRGRVLVIFPDLFNDSCVCVESRTADGKVPSWVRVKGHESYQKETVFFRLRTQIKVVLPALLIGSFALSSFQSGAQTPSASGELAADLQRAQAALKANDQATAAQQFQAVLKLDPSNVEAHANLGAIAFFHNDCAAAEPEFRSALHGAPSLTKARALLALCERRLGEPAAEHDMEDSFAKLDDSRLRTQVGIELADVYYQRGDLERTSSILHTLLTLNPDNIDILFFAQRVYSALADETLNKLAVLAPGTARMEQLIAERLINAGNLKEAIEHYRKALQINPKLPGMHFELAEALMEGSPNDSESQKEAKKELDLATQIDGDSSKIECELGHIALLNSNLDQALTYYRQAYALNAKDPQAMLGLAELLKMQGKLEQAAEYLRTAIAADPLNAEAHYKLSQLDRQLHLDDEAKKELKLFLDVRAARDKVKLLYREMNPHAPAAEGSTSGTEPQS
jgi:tetratricopeptide (TPR) repeat protein